MPRRTIETQHAQSRAGEPPARTSLISASEDDMRELIAIRAFELYSQRGALLGDEVTDWLTAEAEVLRSLQTDPLYLQKLSARSRNGAKRAAPKLTSPARARKTPATRSNRKNKPESEAA